MLKAYGSGGRLFTTGKEAEVGMFYGVELLPKVQDEIQLVGPPWALPSPDTAGRDTEPDCPPAFDEWCHACSVIELQPAKSLVFSVPREALCGDRMIYLVFNYAWEQRAGYAGMDDEPEHRVYFSSRDLPKQSP